VSETSKHVESAIKWLSGLPEVLRKPEKKTKLDFVRELRPHIETAIKRGHSLEDIAKGLADNGGIKLGTATLKNYLQKARAESGEKSTRKKRAAKTGVAKKSAVSPDTSSGNESVDIARADEAKSENKYEVTETKKENGFGLGPVTRKSTDDAFPQELLNRGKR
jgi:IS30 family transposase